MKPGRRLSLQLTPLLDLLLIVIFAQYMEVRDQQAADQSRARDLSAQQAALVVERENLETQLTLARARAEQAESQQRSTAAELEAAESQRRASEENLDRALAQQRVLGELVVELFQIPADDVARILSPTEFPAGSVNAAELERLRERFRQMSVQRSGQMIEHLLSYEEIRKRCDVWDLHIDAQGVATISAGGRNTRLRVPMNAAGDVDRDAFSAAAFDWYRSLPQPKSLVVVLLTYDRRSRSLVVDGVRQALPLWISRMQTDGGGRIRFEYADLGFRID